MSMIMAVTAVSSGANRSLANAEHRLAGLAICSPCPKGWIVDKW